jgi:DNA-directed RNA polymerase
MTTPTLRLQATEAFIQALLTECEGLRPQLEEQERQQQEYRRLHAADEGEARQRDDAVIERQRQWEDEAIQAGIRRYREGVYDKATSDTSAGQQLIREVMQTFVPYLTTIQEMERDGYFKPAGRTAEWVLLLQILEPETLAFLTLRAVLSERPSPENHLRTLSDCARTLGSMIEDQVAYETLAATVRAEKREAKALGKPYEDAIDKMKLTNKNVNRRSLQTAEKAYGKFYREPWSSTLRNELGGKLIEHMVDCTGGAYFEIDKAYTSVVARKAGKAARKTPRVIKLTDKARALIENQHARMELLTPIRRPMKCQPQPWEWDAERGCYVGGYYLLPDNGRIHGWGHKHTAVLTRPFSAETLRAINTLQNVPWQINRDVFNVMKDAMDAGLPEKVVPPADNKPLPPPLPTEIWDAMSDAEHQEYKDELADIHGDNVSIEGKRYSWLMKLDMAEKLVDEKKIWFPWYADFRGRLYPEVTDLTPQGNDASKALLRFANGKPLGKDGLWWLYVRAANDYANDGPLAVDKQALADRYQWTERNLDRILEAAENPLDGTRWWTAAKDAWCFLATCFEIAGAHRLDNPEQFISHLPVNLDGSCNGLQHLAAMGRDEAGCRATNVIGSKDGKRRDIYDEVKESVKDQVAIDAGKGDELAKLWRGNVDRDTVKRAVMTTGYGVTERGMSTQLIEDGFTEEMGSRAQQRQAADYLQKVIVKALDKKLGSAKAIMAWLQAVAEALAQHNIPFRWKTPSGNEIEQAYWKKDRKEVRTLYGKLIFWEERPGTELRLAKQKQAAAPNVVHSYDASHLVRTINACSDRELLDDFSAIHDSFGVHACDTMRLFNALRRELARIYETNWLQEIEDYVRGYAPQVQIPSWSETIKLGELDFTGWETIEPGVVPQTLRADYDSRKGSHGHMPCTIAAMGGRHVHVRCPPDRNPGLSYDRSIIDLQILPT